MKHIRLAALLSLAVAGAGVAPCPGLDLGLCVGSHSASAYVDDWPAGEVQMTWHTGIVGLQGEQELSPAVVGLRAAFMGSYSQPVYTDFHANWYRGRLFGAHVRAHAAFRKHLVADVVSADAGLAFAFDCYRVYEYTDARCDGRLFTQAVTAGLRVNANRRLRVGLDVDLNLAREGWSTYYFYEEEPPTFAVYNAGFMAPSLALGLLLSL